MISEEVLPFAEPNDPYHRLRLSMTLCFLKCSEV